MRRPLTAAATVATVAAVFLAGVLGSAPAALAFQNNPTNGPSAGADSASGERCADRTDRVLTGTLLGADGLFVNATIGFDLTDGHGHTIDLGTGCAAHGYSTILQLNHGTSGEGSPAGTAVTEPDGSAGVVSSTFTIRDIPANVADAWVEVYPRTADPSTAACGWSCAGKVDTSKYGAVNRRGVPIDGSSLDLRLPLTPAYGGTTGQIQVTLVDGSKPYTDPVSAYSWSMLTPEGSRPDQGWGFGTKAGSASTWTFPALGSGQDYRSRFYLDPAGKRFVEVQHLVVQPGQTTRYTLDVSRLDMSGGRGTLDLKTLPAHSTSLALVGRAGVRCQTRRSGATVRFACTFPKAVRKNTHADVSYYAYGHWIRFTVKQVDAHHRAVLAATMRYVGQQQWRVRAGRYTTTWVATGS